MRWRKLDDEEEEEEEGCYRWMNREQSSDVMWVSPQATKSDLITEISCTQTSSWTVRKATVREPFLLSSPGNCMQLMMRPELLVQETSIECNWRHLKKLIKHVKNTEAKSLVIRWNRGHIEPIVINLVGDSFSDKLSPDKVVTTAVVLMTQWVGYNILNK